MVVPNVDLMSPPRKSFNLYMSGLKNNYFFLSAKATGL